MIHKRSICILTSIVSAAISPLYAAVNLTISPYMPRETLNLQGGHGWEDDIDALLPLIGDCRHLFYANGSLDISNTYSGGDVGIGYRQLAPDNSVIYGAYGFFGRFETNHDHYYSQVNLGLEILGNTWDARVNAYIPTGNKQYLDESALTGYFFQGHKLRANQLVTREIAESGADVEVGYSIPYFSKEDSTLRTYLGYYHYGFNDHALVTNGGRIRAEYRYNNFITLTASESYDKLEGNEFVLGIRLSTGTSRIMDPCTVEYRMTEYIPRRRGLYSTRHQSSQPFVSPENFYFVNNAAASLDITTASAGNGTYEHPYTAVQPAEADASTDGNPHTNYVYIYGTGTPYNLSGRLNIGQNQIFMGSGTDLIYRGVNVLPRSGTPTLIGGLNVSSDNVLTGFNLDGTDTGLNAGITGNNIQNIYIHNISISNYTGNDGNDGADGEDGTNGTDDEDPTNGTAGSNAGNGESGYGIHLTNARQILISNVNITNINGGNGGLGGWGGNGGDGNNTTNGANAGDGGAGGQGGNAIGIGLENTIRVHLQNINISNLTGGTGNTGGNGGDGGNATTGPANPPNAGGQAGNAGAGGDAGDAIGIQFLGTPIATMNTVTISGLTAGAAAGIGGNGGDGGDAGGTAGGTPKDGGDGGNGGNGGNGGDAIGIQQNGAIISSINTNISGLTATTGADGGDGGLGGTGIQGGSDGTDGTPGATGSDGITANTTP